MTTRRGIGLLTGATALLILGGLAWSLRGIGAESRAYGARLAEAERKGLDLGWRRRLARDAAKDPARRRAYDRFVSRLAAYRSPANPGDARGEILALARMSRGAEGGAHRDWAQGFDLVYPENDALFRLRRDVPAIVLADARAGRREDALAMLEASAGLLRAFRDDPSGLLDAARSAYAIRVLRAAAPLLAAPALTRAQAERLAALAEDPLFRIEIPDRMRLAEELLTTLNILNRPERYDRAREVGFGRADRRQTEVLSALGRSETLRRAWKGRALALYDTYIPHLPEDPLAFDARARVLRDYGAAFARGGGMASPLLDRPGGPELVEGQRVRVACARVLRLAAGLRAGRAEAELRRGDRGVDPFDGRPLRVRRTGGAWPVPVSPDSAWTPPRTPPVLVYSVGPDRKDDGGAVGKTLRSGDLALGIP